MKRRSFIQGIGALSATGAMGAPALARAAQATAKGKVVVIGGGYGGATAAKYLKLFSGGSLDVTLVEPNEFFVSCPLSNLVLGGSRTIADLTVPYDGLSKNHGIKVVRDRATAIDPAKRTVTLAGGDTLPFDRLVVSPGIDFMWDRIQGLDTDEAREQIPHAWQAGPQTVNLRKQLEAMPDGGKYVLTIPAAPYRCPPGPYERVCQVAWYFKQHKPKSKVLVFDANQDVTSKGALFKKVWSEDYAGLIDYQPQFNAVEVDAATRTVTFEMGEEIQADVLNVLPPMRAGRLAVDAGLATANGRWCEVDFLTFESVAMPGVHVLGDSIQIAPGMPKSGHMANQHGKTVAGAIVALLSGQPVNPAPLYANTCYSFTSNEHVVHVASVHRYDAEKKTMLAVQGAGGLSGGPTRQEGQYAMGWARNIWADMLA